jgi:hypothetical protein
MIAKIKAMTGPEGPTKASKMIIDFPVFASIDGFR